MNGYQPYYYPVNNYRQYPTSEIIAHQMPAMLYPQLKNPTLNAVRPFVNYGLQEAKYTSYKHALEEIAAIAYLLGKGFNPQTAHQIVESWELNEYF
ncbi:hypothetical protein IC621_10505 [Bacillus sp. IB182487]|uniref:Uncharacterized protein n=1 Tax=Metabacillus arenae TaxID=2771434 RepID=A0A926RXG7_9BACI|nr:hypothetical protein [Metabacillus arenae]